MGKIKDLRWEQISMGKTIQLENQYGSGQIEPIGNFLSLQFFNDPFAMSGENVLIRDGSFRWYISDCLKLEDLLKQLEKNNHA